EGSHFIGTEDEAQTGDKESKDDHNWQMVVARHMDRSQRFRRLHLFVALHLLMPESIQSPYLGKLGEVVEGSWRRDRPFQGPAVPGIVTDRNTVTVAVDNIDDEQNCSHC